MSNNRYNQAFMEHTMRNPKAWANAIATWFQAHLSKDAVIRISKVDQDLYRWDAQNVTGMTSVSFFKTYVPLNAGMPSDTFTPPTDEHMGIIGMTIQEGFRDPISDSDWVNGVNDAAVKQARLSIIVNGDTKINSIPLTEAIANITDRETGYIPLKSWLAWEGNTNLELRVDFPVVPTTLNLNLRIILEGFGFGA